MVPDFQDRLEGYFFRLATAASERGSAYRNGQPQQMQLFVDYQSASLQAVEVPALDDVGFRVFSQFDEDGLLLYILSVIGMGRRRCIDIGCGRPMGSNSANLFVNWLFKGVGIDGNHADVQAARRWYSRCRSTMFSPPAILHKIVTEQNINELVQASEEAGSPLDVMSLDIDGIDFWVWKNLRSSPRVVIAEFNPAIPQGHSVTVPRREPITTTVHLKAGYYGCSLEALVELGRSKGYRLVGVSAGVNAFFVLESEIPQGLLPPLTASEALSSPRRSARFQDCEDEVLLSYDWALI